MAAKSRINKGIDDELKLKFTNLFLEASKELQRVKIWTDETPDEKTGKKQWDSLFEKTLKELYVLYGYFVEYNPNDDEVRYFIEGNPISKANPDFLPPYIPYFEGKDEKISEELFNVLKKSQTKLSSQIQSPKVFQHLPVQPKERNSFEDFELISDKCLNCHVPCEIRSRNDYYVVLFDEVAFFQFAYSTLNSIDFYKHYKGQKKVLLKYILKFAIGIEHKLRENNLFSYLGLTEDDKKKWNTQNEILIRKKIDKLVERKCNNWDWLSKVNEILKQVVSNFITKTRKFDLYKRESTISDLEILKHISRFDIEASFEIKSKEGKPLLHDVFVFPIYTQKAKKVFTIKCVQEKELDVHSPILLVLYIKTRKYIDGKLDEDEDSVDGFQLTKEITKLFAEKILQEDYLKNIIRKETRLHATRAAISQVMARNTSHNIGAHVMNTLIGDLRELISFLLNGKTNYKSSDIKQLHIDIETNLKKNAWYSNAEDNVKLLALENEIALAQISIFNNYVKCRMDYLSDITLGTPVMHTNKKVREELYKDFDRVRLLLDNISGLSENFPFQIKFTFQGNELITENDFSIALPNDLLGCQAFYNIIENVIRNTAKHNQNKSGITTFTVNFQEILERETNIVDKELWYQVEIFDDIKVVEIVKGKSINSIKELVKAQNEKINMSVLEGNSQQLRTSALGLLEMKASAAYIRKMDTTDIDNEDYLINYDTKISNSCNNLNILKAIDKNGALGYRFFVSKPTEFLFIGNFGLKKKQLRELAKIGIWVRTEKEFTEQLESKVIFNHQFLIYNQSANIESKLQSYTTSLPVIGRRLKIIDPSSIANLFKNDFTFSQIEDWIWQKWFNENRGSFEYINVMTSYSKKKHNQPNRYNISISHHDTTIESCKNDFGKNINTFEVFSSNALNKLPNINGKDLVDYIDQLKEDNVPNNITKFKLFEAYTNIVAVIDERIQRYSNETYLGLENKEIFSFTNILLPNDIELANDNYNEVIIKEIEIFAEKAIADSKCKFLVVHYSILERMYGSRDKKIDETLIKWSEKTRVIVTSGRGKPPELPDKSVCYVNLSPILNAFTQVRSKYAINYLLNTARK